MQGNIGTWMLVAATVLGGAGGFSPPCWGCPGCQPTGLTFTDEMAEMDVVVLVRLVQAAPQATAQDRSSEISPAKFEIARVLKGESLARAGEKIETLYFGDGQKGDSFLILGITRPKIMWSTPLHLSDKAVDYLVQITKLPKHGVDRYSFFQDYLEDEDAILARDAYDEFAKASYATLRAFKDHLRHDQLVDWIKNPDIPASRRRLYFVMLGICGNEQDLPLLEELMLASDREQRRGMDMIIFSYLSIRGEAGLKVIEDRFLGNPKCEYSDTYAAIMALRFHASEGIVLKPQHAVQSLRLVLARPELADLVIPDLARWEDWSVMDKLLELYKSADEKSSWVRVPVVNYLRACPLPKAKELIAECEKIDPLSVKRAQAIGPAPAAAPAPGAEKATRAALPGQAAPRYVSTPADALPVVFEAPVPQPDPEPAMETLAAPTASAAATDVAKADAAVASINPGTAPAKALKVGAVARPNLWLLLGVPIMAGAVLWILQSSILRGRIGRS